MEWLFGRKMTPDEMLRKNQRALNKVMKHFSKLITSERKDREIFLNYKHVIQYTFKIKYDLYDCICENIYCEVYFYVGSNG